MGRSSSSQSLLNAKAAKQDEFYTQLDDVGSELGHYRAQLRGKTVLCNCDDPCESNFFKYFALNFNALGIKKLIAASYGGSPIVGSHLPPFDIEGPKPECKGPYAIEICEIPDRNDDGAIDLTDVGHLLRHSANAARALKGDGRYRGGDFRSRECAELLREADVVITNPPFSLFREYVAQLVAFEKLFLIIGNVNAITYKEIFKLIKENKLWLGESIHSGDREFRVPDHYPLNAAGSRIDENGNKFIRVKGVRWFTNMDNPKRHEEIPLYKKYDPAAFPRYDNYDAIDVGRVAEIPADYGGAVGVPITFLDKYNPNQFEILGITSGRDEFEAVPTKRYLNPKQINPDGTETNGSKANTRATLLLREKPTGVYYAADNADGPLSILYARIIIKRKEAAQ